MDDKLTDIRTGPLERKPSRTASIAALAGLLLFGLGVLAFLVLGRNQNAATALQPEAATPVGGIGSSNPAATIAIGTGVVRPGAPITGSGAPPQ